MKPTLATLQSSIPLPIEVDQALAEQPGTLVCWRQTATGYQVLRRLRYWRASMVTLTRVDHQLRVVGETKGDARFVVAAWMRPEEAPRG